MSAKTISGLVMIILIKLEILPAGQKKVFHHLGFLAWLCLFLGCFFAALVMDIIPMHAQINGSNSVAEIFQLICWSILPGLYVMLALPLSAYHVRLNLPIFDNDCAIPNPGYPWLLFVIIALRIGIYLLYLKGNSKL